MDSDAVRREVAGRLAEARERTLRLIAPLSEEELRTQHDPLMGPILWDLGHIGQFEELWLVRHVAAASGAVAAAAAGGGSGATSHEASHAASSSAAVAGSGAGSAGPRAEAPVSLMGEMPGMFNPFENPRAVRGRLELPSLGACLRMLEEIRARVLERLATVEFDEASPLLAGAYVYHMVLQHEYQHNETMLQTLQLKRGAPYAPSGRAALPTEPPAPPAGPGAMVRFPGGRVELGTADRTWAYDNERPPHTVELAPFWIDVTPVTNGEYLAFMEDGGYARRELWSEAGWRWLEEAGVDAPKYWERTEEAGPDGRASSGTSRGWRVRTLDRIEPVDPRRPVCHVCWYEAEAYARWAGKRLPTEAEWETAATWDPERRVKLKYPWGNEAPGPEHANLDQLAFGTAPVGAYPRSVSPIGCHGMIGDVWEWTASAFRGYPGFTAFPYREYSEVFFGAEYRVLRGGSWATRRGAIRATFRNWDYPIRRQIFSGFRCARDD